MPLFYKTTRTLVIHFRPILLALFLGLATLPALAQTPTQTTWNGSTSSNWATAGNWSDGVPTTALHAIIPPVDRFPQIEASTAAEAKSVIVQSGASLTIVSGASLTINDYTGSSIGNVSFLNEGEVQNSGQLIIGNLSSLSGYALSNTGSFTNTGGGRIQIDRAGGEGLYNVSGTFTNAATIVIGSISSIPNTGLYNKATFNNTTGGNIQIDRSFKSIENATGGTFTNSATITIGNTSGGNTGILNKATFYNNAGSIQIDRATYNGLDNESGTFTNAAAITIGANASGGSEGLRNNATFYNNTGGTIQIDRTTTTGLSSNANATFVNLAMITIGSLAGVGGNGMYTFGSFTNNAGGNIQIDRSTFSGLTIGSGTFTNAATIKIGSLAAVGSQGITMSGTFNNNAGGDIQIDRATVSGISNTGTFTNAATIKIGSLAAVGSYGIYTFGTFNNNAGGDIQIDRTTNSGITNYSTFTNAATIKIGSLAEVGEGGIITFSSFTNNTGGTIQIDRTTTNGILVTQLFTNAATIKIGSLAAVGSTGIRTAGRFNNNAGGNIQIDRTTNSGINNVGTFTNEALMTIEASMATYGSIYNTSTINNNCGGVITIGQIITSSNTFTNSGTIIEKASGNSSISSNTGLVQNLNGGDFTITTNSGTLTSAEGTFWTGCTSTNWATATNWSGGAVPTTADDVVILSGTANQPTIGASTSAVANSVGVESGAILTIASSATLTINGSKSFSAGTATFFNEGEVQNSGHLLIGNLNQVGTYGLYNKGTFGNTGGGRIQIDGSTHGLWNESGTFTNTATIAIGSLTILFQNGLINKATFDNNAGGNIQIDRAVSYGLANQSGTFTNKATITLGSLAATNFNQALNNKATFYNNEGATIQIDRTSAQGLTNETGGTFTNNATITIGSLAGISDGITNWATFDNNAGSIQIDRSSNYGLQNLSGTFTNATTITIGANANAGIEGLVNKATFNNNAGGNIQIDRVSFKGLFNHPSGTFTNEATINIGGLAEIGIFGISADGTFNNNGCGAVITTHQIINTIGTFTNSGTIIEKAGGTSNISSNSGRVRNLNGGTFTITTNTGVLTTTDGTAAPTITATPSLTVNSGQSVTLTADGATSYHWSTGETTPAISVTAAGPYSVTGTIGECSQVASVTLTVNIVTDVMVSNPAAVCAPATVDLTQGVATSSIPNATFYFYTDADGTQLVPNPAAVGGGTYYVKATSQEGGASSLKSITVVINTSPTVSISPTNPTICSGQSMTLTASGANTYLWSTGATSATINASSAGVVSVTGTSNGCSATATQTVTENSIPAPTLTTNVSASSPGSATVIQNTPFVTLTASGCSGTLAWTGPNNPSGSTVTVPTSATGTLSYTVFCQQDGCSSPPTSFTVYVTTPTTTGNFDGFVNGADCGTFRGWAWDRSKPNTAFSIQILDGPTVIGTLLAGDFRQDLLDAGKGNGRHAFRFTIPESIKDGLPHHLSARIAESSFILKDSPKALICAGTAPVGNKPPVPPTPTVLIAPLSAQVGVPFSGTLAAFTDPEGTTMSYGLSELPTGLSLNPVSRVISGTPTEAGTFVLTYSATDEGGANNSVSFNLTINPAQTTTVTGSFEGYLDKLDCGGIRGWVWDRNKPNTPLTVEFYLEGSSTVLGSAVANIYRVDLKDAGKGNGAHAYNFTPPGSVTNGTKVRARVLGSTYDLKGSPKEFQCATARLSAETGSDLQVRVLGNPVLGQSIEVEIRGAEGQPITIQLTDPTGREVGQRQIELAKPMERQTFSVGQQPAGLLVLRVRTVLKTVTLKIVKQ